MTIVHAAVADPGLRSGANIFLGKVADRAKGSHVNEVSFHGPGSMACLRALEALGFFFAEYTFSLFSRYLFYDIFETVKH